jgi:hypothetical protein
MLLSSTSSGNSWYTCGAGTSPATVQCFRHSDGALPWKGAKTCMHTNTASAHISDITNLVQIPGFRGHRSERFWASREAVIDNRDSSPQQLSEEIYLDSSQSDRQTHSVYTLSAPFETQKGHCEWTDASGAHHLTFLVHGRMQGPALVSRWTASWHKADTG